LTARRSNEEIVVFIDLSAGAEQEYVLLRGVKPGLWFFNRPDRRAALIHADSAQVTGLEAARLKTKTKLISVKFKSS
jgi:hypothetical protein